jgi:hypothetical protein
MGISLLIYTHTSRNAAGGLKRGMGVHHTNIKVIKNVIL